MKKVLSLLFAFWGVSIFGAFDIDIEKDWFPQVVQVIVTLEGDNGQVVEKKGSGVIVFSSSGILTSSYLIKGAKSMKIKYGDKFYEGKGKFLDMATKLSIIDAVGLEIGMMKTGNTNKFAIGDEVGIAGYGFSDKCIFTHGYIIAKRGIRELDLEDVNWLSEGEAFLIDANISEGLIGSGVFNQKGELLGICSHVVKSCEKQRGYGVVIPRELIKKTMGHFAM